MPRIGLRRAVSLPRGYGRSERPASQTLIAEPNTFGAYDAFARYSSSASGGKCAIPLTITKRILRS